MALDFIENILIFVVQPITAIATLPTAKQYWLYLAAAFALSLGAYLFRSRRPSLNGMMRFCLPWRIFGHPSARADYQIWIINAVVAAALSPILIGSGVASYQGMLFAIRSIVGVGYLGWSAGPVAVCIGTILNLLALDLSLFITHYASHRIPLLWEFHKVHHSAAVLTPFTVFRVHPVELMFNLTAGAIIANAASALVVFCFGADPALTVGGLNVLEIAFYFAGYHLRHSHVWIMYPGWIGRHISSPALHLIHHSVAIEHRDKNLAQIFTLWDRLAGTLYLPAKREHIVFGIGDGQDADYQTLGDLYLNPLRAVGRSISPAIRAAARLRE